MTPLWGDQGILHEILADSLYCLRTHPKLQKFEISSPVVLLESRHQRQPTGVSALISDTLFPSFILTTASRTDCLLGEYAFNADRALVHRVQEKLQAAEGKLQVSSGGRLHLGDSWLENSVQSKGHI